MRMTKEFSQINTVNFILCLYLGKLFILCLSETQFGRWFTDVEPVYCKWTFDG